jgi:hypothetical protein
VTANEIAWSPVPAGLVIRALCVSAGLRGAVLSRLYVPFRVDVFPHQVFQSAGWSARGAAATAPDAATAARSETSRKTRVRRIEISSLHEISMSFNPVSA